MLSLRSMVQGLNVSKVFAILFGVFLLSSAAAAEPEDQAGLRYWNEISKDAIETGSGLQYKVLIMGNGRKPKANGKVTVHYRGLLLNGFQFDSSFADDEPVSFSLKRVIAGWTEGIQLMPGGSVFVFLIPPDLAYGTRGKGSIPPDATLIFEIELFGTK